MKKIIFIMTIALVFTLSGCQEKPFESDVKGYTFIEDNELVFNYDNGSGEVELFRYQFTEDLKMFVNDDYTIYNFKNINEYQTASDQIKALIETFEGTIAYNSVSTTNAGSTVELSTGATEKEYNLIDVEHDGIMYREDAYISTPSGVSMLVSYTRFQIDGEDLYVPAYIQLFASSIHLETSWEYLGENNDYSDDPMKLISYELLIVPLPMKTGVLSSYEELLETGTEVDDFTRVVSTNSDNTGIWLPCVDDQTVSCINPISTTLEIQVYETTINAVKEFYEVNFGAKLVDGDFTFYHDGQAFVLYDLDEVRVEDTNEELIDVVNGKIRLS